MEKHIIENEIDKGEQENIGTGLDDFEILQTLGKGSYGFVSKVKSKKNQKIYALKMIDLALVNDPQEVELLMNEIKIIQSLDSPHIVKFYLNFKINQKLYILMEYINNGDIKGYIQANLNMQKTIPESEIWELMYQCMSGLYYIHNNNLIHRDIKPANLFLTDEKVVKIGDFGVSAERKMGGGNFHQKIQKETLMIGTPLYMSPEIFAHKPYGSKVDIYSLGCTFYELCFFSAPRLPLPGVNQNGEIFTDLKDIPPKYNLNCYTKDLMKVIYSMIEKDEKKRPNSEQVFSIIKDKYNSFKIQSSSIFCVYRCLLSNDKLCVKLAKHIPPQDQIYNKPITYTFNMASNNMLIPNTQSYPIIHQIRTLLTFNNPTFIDPGEIDCIDLIDYIIKRFFLENNRNVNCTSCNLYTEVGDNDIFNRETLMSKYFCNFRNFFKSFVSNFFFGTFEITRDCLVCQRKMHFFENFYYLTININKAIKSNINMNGQDFITSCLQLPSKINVNKLCPYCKNVTNQIETKEIFALPNIIIINIKSDDKDNNFNLNYPFTMNLNNKILNSFSAYNLNAVIQQITNNGQKLYGCAFSYNQNWYFQNGYNITDCKDSPYKFCYGNVVMLFYSAQNP